MSKDKDIKNGLEADRILGSQVFKDALKNLKEEYVQHWLSSRAVGDVTLREDFHKAILLLPEIERHLRIIAEKGKLTKSHIDKIKKIV